MKNNELKIVCVKPYFHLIFFGILGVFLSTYIATLGNFQPSTLLSNIKEVFEIMYFFFTSIEDTIFSLLVLLICGWLIYAFFRSSEDLLYLFMGKDIILFTIKDSILKISIKRFWTGKFKTLKEVPLNDISRPIAAIKKDKNITDVGDIHLKSIPKHFMIYYKDEKNHTIEIFKSSMPFFELLPEQIEKIYAFISSGYDELHSEEVS